MGSCFSKNNQGRDPPAVDPGLSPPEEETVKEVLSETPAARTTSSAFCCSRESQHGPHHQGAAAGSVLTAAIAHCPSEIAYATSASEKKAKARGVRTDHKATEEPHSPAAKCRARRSFSGAELPAKRPDPSMRPLSLPRRKSDVCVGCRSSSPTPAGTKKSTDDNISVSVGCRSARSSSPSTIRKKAGAVRRTNSTRETASSRALPPGSSSPRPGEGSGSRRSFSTAANRVAPDLRSPGGRKSLSSPRLSTGASSSPRRIPRDGRRPVHDSVMEASTSPEAGKESMENPLVSLECFIFL